MLTNRKTMGWGELIENGSEIWDALPVIQSNSASWLNKLKLLFYPKKFLLYYWIYREIKVKNKSEFRVLDLGCGTGGTVIDLKRLFGKKVKVIGLDVVCLQVELAQNKLRSAGVEEEILWYDGTKIPFMDNYFDIVYSSDVLGHVENVPFWLKEIQRVLLPNGLVVMFSESALGSFAWIRKYLYQKGLNVDPHAKYHISLYSKKKLQELFASAGLSVFKMFSAIWPSFFLYPDEYYFKLQSQDNFFILKKINQFLFFFKKKLHPLSTALVELYSLLEMLTIGRIIDSQGFLIKARKK